MNLIATTSVEEAKKRLKSTPRPHIVQAQSEQFNRTLVESGLVDILILSNTTSRKDTLRAIDFGISVVLLRIAAKKRCAIGIDLEVLRALTPERQARELMRIAELIRLARTAHTTLALSGAGGIKEQKDFLQSLGASSQQATQALTF